MYLENVAYNADLKVNRRPGTSAWFVESDKKLDQQAINVGTSSADVPIKPDDIGVLVGPTNLQGSWGTINAWDHSWSANLGDGKLTQPAFFALDWTFSRKIDPGWAPPAEVHLNLVLTVMGSSFDQIAADAITFDAAPWLSFIASASVVRYTAKHSSVGASFLVMSVVGLLREAIQPSIKVGFQGTMQGAYTTWAIGTQVEAFAVVDVSIRESIVNLISYRQVAYPPSVVFQPVGDGWELVTLPDRSMSQMIEQAAADFGSAA